MSDSGWTCKCGVANEQRVTYCELCGAERPAPPPKVSGMWTCACQAVNLTSAATCGSCGKLRHGSRRGTDEPGARVSKVCQVCHQEADSLLSINLDVDGVRRCAGCHVGWLKSQMAKPDDVCNDLVIAADGSVGRCGKTVAEHMAEFREAVTKIAARHDAAQIATRVKVQIGSTATSPPAHRQSPETSG